MSTNISREKIELEARCVPRRFALKMLAGAAIVVMFWITLLPSCAGRRLWQLCLAALALTGLALCSRFPRWGIFLSTASTGTAWLLNLTYDPFLIASIALFIYAEGKGKRQFPRIVIAMLATFLLALLVLSVEGLEEKARGIMLSAGALAGAWALGVRTRQGRLEAMARAEADERVRLSGEIHDVLSYSLGTIGVRAGVAARVSCEGEGVLREAFREIEQIARSGVQQLQTFLDRERQPSDSFLPNNEQNVPWSLHQEIQNLVQSCEQAHISTKLNLSERLAELPDRIGTTVFRVIREFMVNAMVHGGATEIMIDIVLGWDVVKVTVLDNGCGSIENLCPGHGLTLMRERVSLLDGEMTLADRPDGGLSACVMIPLTSSLGCR